MKEKMKIILVILALVCCVQGKPNSASRLSAQLDNILQDVDGLKRGLREFNAPMEMQSTEMKPEGKTTGMKPTGMKPTGMKPSGMTTEMKPTEMKPTGMKPTGMKPTGMKPTGMKPTGMKPTGGEKTTGQKPPSPEQMKMSMAAKLMMIKSLKTNVAQLFLYKAAIRSTMEKFMKKNLKEKVEGEDKKKDDENKNKMPEEKGEGGPKMPPSTLIGVVLDIVQNIYWEAKRLSVLGQMKPMTAQEKAMKPMETLGSKKQEDEGGDKKKKVGVEELMKKMGFKSEEETIKMYGILDKMTEMKWVSEHKEEIQKMLKGFEGLANMYQKLKKFKEMLKEAREEKEHDKRGCSELQDMFGDITC